MDRPDAKGTLILDKIFWVLQWIPIKENSSIEKSLK